MYQHCNCEVMYYVMRDSSWVITSLSLHMLLIRVTRHAEATYSYGGRCAVSITALQVFSERKLYAIARPSVICRLSVCL